MFRLEESIIKEGTWLRDDDFGSYYRVLKVLPDKYITDTYENMIRYIHSFKPESIKENFFVLGWSERSITQELTMLYEMLDEIRSKTDLIKTKSDVFEKGIF